MKWRNQILALVCLAVFGALGVLYFKTWVVQKPFGVILFVGEGLTAQRITAARVYSAGADARLAVDNLEYSARLRNCSFDFAVPDSPAAASAIATGSRVKNGALSVDPTGAVLKTILEIAHEQGRATGLVTDGELTNPTTAAFYAHVPNFRAEPSLAKLLLASSSVDLMLGGGAAQFSDKDVAAAGSFHLARKKAELEQVGGWDGTRVLGLFAPRAFAFSDEIAARDGQPSLAEMVRRAIEILQTNRRGYLLVVDAHLMSTAASQNLGERTLRETLELDAAVAVAREYGGNQTSVFVVGDVAIGGMTISGYPFRYDSGVAILGLNSAGEPWVTWASGPNGERPRATEQSGIASSEPATVAAPAAAQTLEDPLALGSGMGAEDLHGTLDATRIFSLLEDAL